MDLRIFGGKMKKQDPVVKTVLLAKERANDSPTAVRILFSKISNHVNAFATLFCHPEHKGVKLLGGGRPCNCPGNDYAENFENGTVKSHSAPPKIKGI